jgi:uncharacterized protein YegJ (DUF2314 family)
MHKPIMRSAAPTPLSVTLFGAAIFVALITVLAGAPAAAQSITQKAERDELAIVAKSDPVMAAAMQKARQTLPDFLNTVATPKPGMEGFAVKVAVREGDTAEYFWIAPFTNNNGAFSGAINNTPRSVRSVKLGQTITFSQAEIVDWMYMDGDKMKGNYTACALLKSASKQEADEFKTRFGLDCDF